MRSGPRERIGVLTVKLFRPFSVHDFVVGAAADRARHRRSRSHEGTWRHRGAAVSGRGDGHRRSACRRDRALHGLPEDHRRALWAGLERVHPGDGQSGVRRARPPRAEARFHGRHRRRRDRAVARGRTRRFNSSRRAACAPCSSALAPTARWVRTRTPSRSSARRPTTSRRRTSCTTRRSPAPSRSRT